jgi:hypothetical protein
MTAAAASDPAVPGAWLAAPWAEALLTLVVDFASEADPAVLPAWPDWAPRDQALAVPSLRRRLGRLVLPDPPGTIAQLLAGCAMPRGRLALLPQADGLALMQRAAAWWHAPYLANLLKRAEVEAARAALGPSAFTFGLRGGRLLPRPTHLLVTAVEARLPAGSTELMDSGAVLLGLAIGETPATICDRLALRSPTRLWRSLATACREDASGPAAFAAIERLIREAAPAWSSWLR